MPVRPLALTTSFKIRSVIGRMAWLLRVFLDWSVWDPARITKVYRKELNEPLSKHSKRMTADSFCGLIWTQMTLTDRVSQSLYVEKNLTQASKRRKIPNDQTPKS